MEMTRHITQSPAVVRMILLCGLAASGTAQASPRQSRGVFGSGQSGSLSWEVRAHAGGCAHPDKPASWCDESDRPGIVADMGIEDMMVREVNAPGNKFVAVSYYAFGSPRVADAICERTRAGTLRAIAILQDWPNPRGTGSDGYRKLVACAENNPALGVTKLGGEGGIHHAKIFVASESLNPFDPSDLRTDARIIATVSSANLSHNGVGMHLENWLIMQGPASNQVLRGNWCYVNALPLLAGSRGDFHKANTDCLSAAASASHDAIMSEIEFIPMPATKPAPKAIDALLGMISSSRESIKVAAHIFTAARTSRSGLVSGLIDAARRGVRVEILLDDDTEIVFRRLPGWQRLKVGADDIEAVQTLLSSPVKIKSVDTNEGTSQLHHNKFIIVDDRYLWTGSGNFTASSLAGRNTEQFYVIRDQEITDAYRKIWDILENGSTPFGE